MQPKVLAVCDKAYKNLLAVAQMLEAVSPNNAYYVVSDIYFDCGQDWMWTTICRMGYMDCQVLNPREWEMICLADSLEDLYNAANEVKNGKYFND